MTSPTSQTRRQGSPDQLDRSGIGADIATLPGDAFVGLASAPAAHNLWLAADHRTGDVRVLGHVNGDTRADFEVVPHSAVSFGAADILF